jgi:putative ABC transport system permease protein
LLVGAGLLIHSFERLTHVDPGFRPDHLVVFNVALSAKKYETDASRIAFADALLSRLRAMPGTQSAAVAADRPIDPNRPFEVSTSFWHDGRPKPAPGSEWESRVLPVSPSYFQTLGMHLVRGRTFLDAENRLDAAPVIVINEALARRYFPGENPIGKRLTFGLSHTFTNSPGDSVRARGEIVGVVKNVQQQSLDAKEEPSTYFPFNTLPFGPTFLVRTSADLVAVKHQVRAEVEAVDAAQPIYELGAMDAAMSESVAQPRFYTLLLTAFAAVALFLAALGTYGVVAYAASQRTREFGVRIALGAAPRDVMRLVVRRGVALAAMGVLVGALLAAVATRTLEGLLFGVQPLELSTFLIVALVLGGAATFASWLPARRAARVDPLIAMRSE